MAKAMKSRLRDLPEYVEEEEEEEEQNKETEEESRKRQMLLRHKVEKIQYDIEHKDMLRRHSVKCIETGLPKSTLKRRREEELRANEQYRAMLRQHWLKKLNDDMDVLAIWKQRDEEVFRKKQVRELWTIRRATDLVELSQLLEMQRKEQRAEEFKQLAILTYDREEELRQEARLGMDTGVFKQDAILSRHKEEDGKRESILECHMEEENAEQSQRQALWECWMEENDSRKKFLQWCLEGTSAELLTREAIMRRHQAEINVGINLRGIQGRHVMELKEHDRLWIKLVSKQQQALSQDNVRLRLQRRMEMAKQDAQQEAMYERHIDELISHDKETPKVQGLRMKQQIARREAIYKEHALRNTAANYNRLTEHMSALARLQRDTQLEIELQQKFVRKVEMYKRHMAETTSHESTQRAQHGLELSDQQEQMLGRQKMEVESQNRKTEEMLGRQKMEIEIQNRRTRRYVSLAQDTKGPPQSGRCTSLEGEILWE